MDSSPAYTASNPGVFGTRIPASVVFAVGILLFVLPFAELRCTSGDKDKETVFNAYSNMSFTNSGLGLAIGSNWKSQMSGMGSLFGGRDERDETIKKKTNPDPNAYAIVALVLGIAGLIVAIADKRSLGFIGIAAGLLAAASLVGLMVDLKKHLKDPIPDLNTGDEWTKNMNDVSFKLVFTPWFYIAIVAFLTAAYFSYKRMRAR